MAFTDSLVPLQGHLQAEYTALKTSGGLLLRESECIHVDSDAGAGAWHYFTVNAQWVSKMKLSHECHRWRYIHVYARRCARTPMVARWIRPPRVPCSKVSRRWYVSRGSRWYLGINRSL
jgi:hypothetical protein